jgi:hypothetical protein
MIDMSFSPPTMKTHLRRVDMRSQRSFRNRSPRVARAALSAVLAFAFLSAMPSMAVAADNDSNVDARLVGYPNGKKMAIEKSSATPSYLLFFFLVVVGCVPLFKNAKRD